MQKVDAVAGQDFGVFRRVHPFRHDLQIKGVGQFHHTADEGVIFATLREIATETAIQLDHGERQFFQVAIRGVARAKVIKRHTATQSPQR